MPELDKWQKRQAQAYARENDVSYDAAVKELFPPDPEPEAEAPAEDAPGDKGAKVTVKK